MALELLRSRLAANVQAGNYPGVVYLVAREGRVIAQGAIGVGDTTTGAPMKSDSIFRLLSMTKPITAVAVMILAEEGKVRLDDPVSRYIPEFTQMRLAPSGEAATKPITIRTLLAHTAGLDADGRAVNAFVASYGKRGTLAERMPEIAASPLGWEPGTRWAYSPFSGFDVLARIVEIAAGENFDAFLKHRIFTPLGMKDTGFVLSPEQRSRLVGLYAAKSGAFETEADPFRTRTYFSGSAGLYGSGPDYLKFAQMLESKGSLGRVRILKPASVDAMTAEQIPAGFPRLRPGQSWGLGVRRVSDPMRLGSPLPAGAYGWSGSWGTHFWVDPENRAVGVFMVNLSTSRGASAPESLEFEQLVMAALKP